MITLITGTPGAGKTSFAVSELAKVKDRPIFVMGITDLKIQHQAVPPVAEWVRQEPTPEDPTICRPTFNFPPNSIIVIDEAQNVYRPRPVGSKVPDIVAAFETHRHTGVDFWLITQAPGLIDSNIRKLITKHQHVHVSPLGRKLLEWSQCRDPESKADRADAIRVSYKPPKSSFALYKSAEVHTVVKRRIPNSLIAVVLLVPLFLVVAWYGYGRIAARVSPVATPEVSPVATAAPVAPVVEEKKPLGSYLENEERFTPTDPTRPESAPAYSGLVQVKAVPLIAGCISTPTSCKCLTQQGTDAAVPRGDCESRLRNPRFDPYRSESSGYAFSPAPPAVAAHDARQGIEPTPAAVPVSL